jgi:hypothetical protein
MSSINYKINVMKNLSWKNRIISTSIMGLVTLFIFTGCEKDDDNGPGPGNNTTLKASFIYEADGLSATFTSNSTGNIATYQWNFGDIYDPTAGSEKSVTHKYTTAGDYDVTLIVSSGSKTDSVTQSIKVNFAPPDLIARRWLINQAFGNGAPDPSSTGKKMIFNANGTYDWGSGMVTGIWEFMDGYTKLLVDKGSQYEAVWTIVKLDTEELKVSFSSPWDGGSHLEWNMVAI